MSPTKIHHTIIRTSECCVWCTECVRSNAVCVLYCERVRMYWSVIHKATSDLKKWEHFCENCTGNQYTLVLLVPSWCNVGALRKSKILHILNAKLATRFCSNCVFACGFVYQQRNFVPHLEGIDCISRSYTLSHTHTFELYT